MIFVDLSHNCSNFFVLESSLEQNKNGICHVKEREKRGIQKFEKVPSKQDR